MKEKVFDKMIEYGWTLEDFEEVYNHHYNFIDRIYEKNKNNDTLDFDVISWGMAWDTVCFMSDFLRAINELDEEE